MLCEKCNKSIDPIPSIVKYYADRGADWRERVKVCARCFLGMVVKMGDEAEEYFAANPDKDPENEDAANGSCRKENP